MALLLRKLESKVCWTATAEDAPWLSTGDVQADALKSLRTKENALSLWHIEDDKGNLDQVVACLWAARQALQLIDYALLDAELIEELGFVLQRTAGDTPSAGANQAWHREIKQLSVSKIATLAHWMAAHAEFCRTPAKHLKSLLRSEVSAGRIDRERMDQGLRDKLSL